MANIKKTCLIHQQQGIGDLIFIQMLSKYCPPKYCCSQLRWRMLVDAYSPPRRGGVARSAGVVGSAKSKLCRSDHPVCATSVASRYFLIGAATPPLRGGEYVTV